MGIGSSLSKWGNKRAVIPRGNMGGYSNFDAQTTATLLVLSPTRNKSNCILEAPVGKVIQLFTLCSRVDYEQLTCSDSGCPEQVVFVCLVQSMFATTLPLTVIVDQVEMQYPSTMDPILYGICKQKLALTITLASHEKASLASTEYHAHIKKPRNQSSCIQQRFLVHACPSAGSVRIASSVVNFDCVSVITHHYITP